MLVANISSHRTECIRQARENRAGSKVHVTELAVSVANLVIGRLPEKALVRVRELDTIRAPLRASESAGSAELTRCASRISRVPRRRIRQIILALQGETADRRRQVLRAVRCLRKDAAAYQRSNRILLCLLGVDVARVLTYLSQQRSM